MIDKNWYEAKMTEYEKTVNEALPAGANKFIDIIGRGGIKTDKLEYFIEPHISLERFKALQKLEIEIGFTTTFKLHYEKLESLYKMLNDMKLVDASVILRDVMEGLNRVDDLNSDHPCITYCTLILNTEKEDRNTVDERMIKKKIDSWMEAGIPVNSFFDVALHSVYGLKKIYLGSIRDSSLTEKANDEEE